MTVRVLWAACLLVLSLICLPGCRGQTPSVQAMSNTEAPAAGPQRGDDLVDAEAGAGGERHAGNLPHRSPRPLRRAAVAAGRAAARAPARRAVA